MPGANNSENLTEARQAFGELQTDASEALQNLRDLAHGIYPPVLADLGLAAALNAQAAKSVVPVTVDADGIGRFPQEIEAAVYFCCLEAAEHRQVRPCHPGPHPPAGPGRDAVLHRV